MGSHPLKPYSWPPTTAMVLFLTVAPRGHDQKSLGTTAIAVCEVDVVYWLEQRTGSLNFSTLLLTLGWKCAGVVRVQGLTRSQESCVLFSALGGSVFSWSE